MVARLSYLSRVGASFCRVMLGVMLAGIYAPLLSAAGGAEAQIASCIDTQPVQGTWMQTVELRSLDRIGSEKIILADIAVQPPVDGAARFLAYFRKPDDIRATRLLARVGEDANEMFAYVPILFKTRRITGRQLSTSLHGTDFSYEDLEWLLGIVETKQEPSISSREIGGRMFYVVESVPPQQGSRYESLVSYIDSTTCVLNRIDFFGPGAKKRKVLTVDPASVQQVGEVRLPHRYVMEDLREQTRTHVTVSDIQLNYVLPDTAFEPEYLGEFRGFR